MEADRDKWRRRVSALERVVRQNRHEITELKQPPPTITTVTMTGIPNTNNIDTTIPNSFNNKRKMTDNDHDDDGVKFARTAVYC